MTREEAIKILTNHRRFVFEDSEEDIAIVMAIQSLEQTDGDLISRDKALELVNYALAENKDVLEVLENMPSAEKTYGDLIAEIDKLPRIKVGNSNSPTVKYCIDEVLLYDLLEHYKESGE